MERLTENDELSDIQARLPSLGDAMSSGLQSLPSTFAPEEDAPLEAVLAALWRDGAVVLNNAVSGDCADRVVAEMSPYMDKLSNGDDFTGRSTTRAGAVVARSPASWDIVGHPMLLSVCEAVIGRQILSMSEEELAKTFLPALPGTPVKTTTSKRHAYQCHLHQIIRIGAGEPAQDIHRDAAAFVLNTLGKMEVEVSTIWALNDFTEDIGPTRVVPGSHRCANRLGVKKAIFFTLQKRSFYQDRLGTNIGKTHKTSGVSAGGRRRPCRTLSQTRTSGRQR